MRTRRRPIDAQCLTNRLAPLLIARAYKFDQRAAIHAHVTKWGTARNCPHVRADDLKEVEAAVVAARKASKDWSPAR